VLETLVRVPTRVHGVRDRLDGRLLLLWEYRSHPDLTPEEAHEFLERGTCLASLALPGLLPVVAAFRDGASYCLVTEGLPGRPLSALLEERPGPWPLDEAVALALGLLETLEGLHRMDPPFLLAHLSPRGICLDETGRPCIFGYALGRFIDPYSLQDPPGYVAPEAFGLGRADRSTDLYSVGALLYRMASGLEPPAGSSKLTPPSAGNPELPPALEEVILHALEPEQSRRFRDAPSFRRALCQAAGLPEPEPVLPPPAPAVWEARRARQARRLAGLPGTLAAEEPPPPPPPAPPPDRRLQAILSGAALVVLLALWGSLKLWQWLASPPAHVAALVLGLAGGFCLARLLRDPRQHLRRAEEDLAVLGGLLLLALLCLEGLGLPLLTSSLPPSERARQAGLVALSLGINLFYFSLPVSRRKSVVAIFGSVWLWLAMHGLLTTYYQANLRGDLLLILSGLMVLVLVALSTQKEGAETVEMEESMGLLLLGGFASVFLTIDGMLPVAGLPDVGFPALLSYPGPPLKLGEKISVAAALVAFLGFLARWRGWPVPPACYPALAGVLVMALLAGPTLWLLPGLALGIGLALTAWRTPKPAPPQPEEEEEDLLPRRGEPRAVPGPLLVVLLILVGAGLAQSGRPTWSRLLPLYPFWWEPAQRSPLASATGDEQETWIGGEGAVWLLDQKGGRARRFGADEGLVGNYVVQMEQDDQGVLYVRTERAVCRLEGGFFTTLTERADEVLRLYPCPGGGLLALLRDWKLYRWEGRARRWKPYRLLEMSTLLPSLVATSPRGETWALGRRSDVSGPGRLLVRVSRFGVRPYELPASLESHLYQPLQLLFDRQGQPWILGLTSDARPVASHFSGLWRTSLCERQGFPYSARCAYDGNLWVVSCPIRLRQATHGWIQADQGWNVIRFAEGPRGEVYGLPRVRRWNSVYQAGPPAAAFLPGLDIRLIDGFGQIFEPGGGGGWRQVDELDLAP
jgi:hypothetical protein